MSTAATLVPGMTGMVETTYRLLVPERQTGSIIGKGGEVGTGSMLNIGSHRSFETNIVTTSVSHINW